MYGARSLPQRYIGRTRTLRRRHAFAKGCQIDHSRALRAISALDQGLDQAAPLAAGPPLSVSSLAGEQAGHGRVKICKRLANPKTKMNKVATPEQVEQNQLCGSIALQHKHEKEHDMELAELIENNDESPNRVDNNKTHVLQPRAISQARLPAHLSLGGNKYEIMTQVEQKRGVSGLLLLSGCLM